MLFNSTVFLVFFVIFFFLYWIVAKSRLRYQNILILVASYVFYGWWDWRFVFLLLFSTLIDHASGLLIYNQPDRRKFFMWFSIAANLLILGCFKYYNFFADSFQDLFSQFGIQTQPYILEILLPIGISFYTFHGMSYVIDIYKGKCVPVTNFVDYAVFVSFFPLLVAGPIERANHLLPQVIRPRVFSYPQAVAGCQIILWGFFKKVVIADGVASEVNYIFANYQELSSLTLVIGIFLFAIQIYGDFSGYSDIAIGLAKILGFELIVNFRYPYFSRDIAEFWRRWHISLSSWFRDYLYIPLGGSKEGLAKSIRNTFIIFIVSGFWHGANWTFISWGFLHALFFLPLLLYGKNRTHLEVVAGDRMFPTAKEIFQMIATFTLVCVAWVFFRADSLDHAIHYLQRVAIFDLSLDANIFSVYMVALIVIMFSIEWVCRRSDITYIFGLIERRPYRHFAYYMLVMLIIMYGTFSETAFIYFQF